MLLSAEQLSINFGSRQLLDDVNFYLNEGDKTGVIGINGTGKSTFLKVLAGLVQPDSGRISRRPNLQVSYLPQNPEMDDDRTILEQVFASMPPQFRALNEYEAKAMLTKFGLGETDRRIGTLSGGERRRAALCAALIHPADVLVLDEPTSFLDIRYKIELSAILLHLAREQGVTIVMSLHEIDLAARVSDLVMGIGTHGVEMFGAPEAVFTEENITQLYGISSGVYDALSGSMELPRAEGAPYAFVLGGMGKATTVYRRLTREGTPFATGILAENDMDIPAARHLAARILTTAPFAPPSEAVLTEARQTLLNCGALLIPDGLEAHAWDDELICFAQEHCVEVRHA